MRIKKLFAVHPQALPGDIGLLLLRLVAGCGFMLHGWPKIQNPFGWMGEDAFAPGIFQALAALSEFGGGIAWILGALVPLASLGAACTMAVAVYMHAVMMGDPFLARADGGAYEMASLYLVIALMLMTVGPGRFSLDRCLFGQRGTEKDGRSTHVDD